MEAAIGKLGPIMKTIVIGMAGLWAECIWSPKCKRLHWSSTYSWHALLLGVFSIFVTVTTIVLIILCYQLEFIQCCCSCCLSYFMSPVILMIESVVDLAMLVHLGILFRFL